MAGRRPGFSPRGSAWSSRPRATWRGRLWLRLSVNCWPGAGGQLRPDPHVSGYLLAPTSGTHSGHTPIGLGDHTPTLTLESAGDHARPRMAPRSEEHTSELQSLMRISYAVFCLKKKKI